MRYDLKLRDVPRKCACGQDYSINHCLTCKRGGFVIIRHNAIRDTLAEVLSEVCKDVKIEPALLPVTGEALPAGSNTADGARSTSCGSHLAGHSYIYLFLTHTPSQMLPKPLTTCILTMSSPRSASTMLGSYKSRKALLHPSFLVVVAELRQRPRNF